MPEAAVIGWLVFGVVCIAWRFWYQRSLTDDYGLRGISGGIGSLEWFAGMLVAVSFAASGAVPVLEVAGLATRSVAPTAQIVAGIATMTVGLVLTSVAQIQMGPSWRVGVRPGERTALVTHGIFSVVRNPIFSGVIVSAVGAAMLVPRPVMAMAVVASIVGIEIQVRKVEEPYLATTHGAAYVDYASRVGRFVPGVGKKTILPDSERKDRA